MSRWRTNSPSPIRSFKTSFHNEYGLEMETDRRVCARLYRRWRDWCVPVRDGRAVLLNGSGAPRPGRRADSLASYRAVETDAGPGRQDFTDHRQGGHATGTNPKGDGTPRARNLCRFAPRDV